jgi:bacteriocin leader peptide (microcyclamide/patellamide family)
MDKQNLMPQATQPVNRSTTGQPLPDVLAELSEEALQQLHGDSANEAAVLASGNEYSYPGYFCSYDGDDAE